MGKKGDDILSKSHTVMTNNNGISDDLSFANASAIANVVMEQFSDKAYDKVEVIYNRFKNAATQIVTTETLLPIVASDKHTAEAGVDYIFEPSQEEIVANYCPKA